MLFWKKLLNYHIKFPKYIPVYKNVEITLLMIWSNQNNLTLQDLTLCYGYLADNVVLLKILALIPKEIQLLSVSKLNVPEF